MYYREAKVAGYRARSAYKLLAVQDLFDIFGLSDSISDAGVLSSSAGGVLASEKASLSVAGKASKRVRRVVDLCAAPGSWSQVCAQVLNSRPSAETGEADPDAPVIVAVDLQQMAPIPGVIQLQGDITSEATATAIVHALRGTSDVSTAEPSGDGTRQADLVICDGAPDVTGLHDIDEYLHSQLLVAAWNITTHVLRSGGTFVAKIFKGDELPLLYSQMRLFFRHVDFAKPSSSRARSFESFIVCRDYAPPQGYVPSMKTPLYGSAWLAPASKEESRLPGSDIFDSQSAANQSLMPFMTIGDLAGCHHDYYTTYTMSGGDEDGEGALGDDPSAIARRSEMESKISMYTSQLDPWVEADDNDAHPATGSSTGATTGSVPASHMV